MARTFPYYKQINAMDCGPTCLRMISQFYGKHYNTETLRAVAGFSKEGVSLLGISEAAEKIGLRTRAVQLSVSELLNQARLPCVLHWDHNHFVVAISSDRKGNVKIADPAKGILLLGKKEFAEHWISSVTDDNEKVGTALLLEPTAKFYSAQSERSQKVSWKWITSYLRQSKWTIIQVFVALFTASLLQLIFPFLTQSIVDTGIHEQNLSFISVILMAQLILVLSRSMADFIRSRLLLHLSSVINLSILSDFWIKLMHLPMNYFTQRQTGDTIQRIGDHKQIQNFLTGSALHTFFSLFNFMVYGFVLALYNMNVFLIFIAGSLLYLYWVQFFLKISRKLNYQTFYLSAKENNATLELIEGMPEIKLNNAELIKRWEWEGIQSRIFKLNYKSLSYSQMQQAGATLINQGKDVIITFLVAKLVIEGGLTLGAMVAIQYILGQLSGPIEQFIGFLQQGQEAKISMERLNEVHEMKDEETDTENFHHTLPQQKSIRLKKLSFSYPGPDNEPVLSDIDLMIPEGKLTAIVGVSGSGKTTLLKLLLQYFQHYTGEMEVGGLDLKKISPSFWRRRCGVVLQEGFIFNDSISRNIAVGAQHIDEDRLFEVSRMANILSFIESLPNGFNTILGADGNGISQGQKQRILIARALYKDPDFIFFDEATNALDANNEKLIVENLSSFFRNRTVVVVAHRLSTVRHADKIVVLHRGKVAEEGTHDTLTNLKGKYYELVKNQLELGNG